MIIELPRGPYVYLWLDLSGRPFYVGLGHSGRCLSRERGPATMAICREIEESGHSVTVEVRMCESAAEAVRLERQLISEFGRRGVEHWGILTNVTAGGECSRDFLTRYPEGRPPRGRQLQLDLRTRVMSDETRARISRSMRARSAR